MRNKEVSIYKEIYSELKETVSDIEDDLRDRKRNFDATFMIRNMFLGKEVSKDSFIYYIHFAYDSETANPKSSAFESLKASGLDILTNDTLRQNITTLYQLEIPAMVNSYRINELKSFNKKIEAFINSYLEFNNEAILQAINNDGIGVSRNLRYLYIDDFNSLMKNKELGLTIQKSLFAQRIIMRGFERRIQIMKKMMADIEGEIARLE